VDLVLGMHIDFSCPFCTICWVYGVCMLTEFCQRRYNSFEQMHGVVKLWFGG
jgi:hypothetical protein